MDISIRIADGAVYGDYLWFSNVASNGLFRISIDTKIIEFVDFFPMRKINEYFQHKRCFLYNDRIIFVPAMARQIDIYDISVRQFSSIPFENDVEGEAIMDAAQIDEFIYIFPRNEICVPVQLNAKTLEIEQIYSFSSEINKYTASDKLWKFFRSSVYGDVIYFPIDGMGIIIGWNPKSGTFVTYQSRIKNIINIVVEGDLCYFTVRDNYGIRTLNFETMEIRSVNVEGKCTGNNTYAFMMKKFNRLICVPSLGRYLCVFEDNALILKQRMDEKICDTYKFFRAVDVRGEVWLLPIGIEDMYILGRELSLHRVAFDFDKQSIDRYKKGLLMDFYENNQIYVENIDMGIVNFLAYVGEGVSAYEKNINFRCI